MLLYNYNEFDGLCIVWTLLVNFFSFEVAETDCILHQMWWLLGVINVFFCKVLSRFGSCSWIQELPAMAVIVLLTVLCDSLGPALN